jgi:hypothetical protein
MNEQVWRMEELFWTGGTDQFEAAMHPDCIMAFPAPIGIMAGRRITESLAGAPRWTSVSMKRRQANRPADGVVVLAYEAEGERDGDPPYRAICTSTYARVDGAWRLVQHQQTPQ